MGEETSIEAESARRAEAIRQGCAAFLIYLALACWFFGRGLIGHFSDRFIGREADPSQMIWLMKWWPYAIGHHLNPFLTNYVWAPVGFNFAWMTSIPLVALVAAPLTYTIGLIPTYNVLALLSAPSAACCAFVLCRRLTGSFWPSMLGGFVFGFSSFMLGQTLGHLCLILSFPVPLAAYLIARRLEGSIATRWFVALLAMVLTAEFLIDMEMFATASVVGALGLGIGCWASSGEVRERLLGLLAPMAAAFAICAVVVSPYLYYFLFFEGLHQPLWPSEKFCTDLLNFIVPTPLTLAGTIPALARLTASFTGTVMERDGFIALPLIAVAIAWARRHWKEPLCKVLIVSAVVVSICALGPYLQIGGVPTAPLPWLAIAHLPFLEHAVPDRLMVFPSLAMAVIVALWMVDPESRREMKALAVASTLLLMIPNPSARFWASTMQTPAFFTDGTAQRYMSRNDVVLTLPWGIQGHSMDWQAECDMCFRNVAGWTGMERFAVRRWPIVNYFGGSRDLPEPELQLGAFLANNGVTAVVVDDSSPRADEWRRLIAETGLRRESVSGVSLYRVNPDDFQDARGITGLTMESRALQQRFQTLLQAADSYLTAGYDPKKISPSDLVERGFLPPTWKKQRDGFYDLLVLPRSDGSVIVGELGSPSALKGLIDRYHQGADQIFLPYPKVVLGIGPVGLRRLVFNALLPPASMPTDGESLRFVAFAFNRSQLRAVIRARGPLPPLTHPEHIGLR